MRVLTGSKEGYKKKLNTPRKKFLFQLARESGYIHPDFLLPVLSARQLKELEIMYELAPWGEEREDLRCGIICAAIANFRFGRTKSSKTYTPADFMPDFTPAVKEKKQPGWKQVLSAVENLNKIFGGTDLRGK